MNANVSFATPRAGRSLEGMVAPFRQCVVAAVEAAGDVDAPWLAEASLGDDLEGDMRSRCRWALVSIVLAEMIETGQSPNVRRSLSWFRASATGYAAEDIEKALQPLHGRPFLADLFPYLLDTYGRTSRLDIMRDEALRPNRLARKGDGSFYTPADVASFMVSAIASSVEDPDRDAEWWLDPACGSGVFLVAALALRRTMRSFDAVGFATTRLKGCDVSPQACDFAAFAILNAIAAEALDPYEVWRAIRGNIVAIDALKTSRDLSVGGLRARMTPKTGPMRLVCNPPYALCSDGSTTLADGTPTKSMYLPFIEMAWRVASGPDDAAVLVVPLSLGANRSADHRRCRLELARAGGEWTMMFFDRQPHALFGEDAKTRATIAIRRPGPTPASIRTTGLLKWTSRLRSTIFDEGRVVALGQADIGRIVPKLGSSAEVELYKAVERHRSPFSARPEPVRAFPEEVGDVAGLDVFVAGTAYNFLNVFRSYPEKPTPGSVLSANGIHRLSCSNGEEADALLAILCSRVAFWLWHVECDGFHVPAWFLAELAIRNLELPAATVDRLAALGRLAWAGLQKDAICSSNRGRQTFAFRPTHVADERDEIDQLLLKTIGAGTDPDMLADFERRVVSIDGKTRLAAPFRTKVGTE